MRSFAWILLLLFLPNTQPACVIQGLCQQHNENTFGPCAQSDHEFFEPIKLTDKEPIWEKLQHYCPHLLNGNSSELCCSASQAEGMARQIAQAESILGRCPSCFSNFAKLWCEFTCSSRQSNFVKVIEKKNIENNGLFVPETPNATHYANRMEYRVSEKFANEMFKSCKDVTFAGGSALRLMCTTIPCTVQSWLKFIGTQDFKINIPISTDFVLVNSMQLNDYNETSDYMHVEYSECDKPARPGLMACARIDCNSGSYADSPRYFQFNIDQINNNSCKIYGLDCSRIILAATFILCVVILLCVVLVFTTYEEEFGAYEDGLPDGRLKRTGVWIQSFFEINAKEIGEMAGKKPSAHFLVGFTIIVFCLSGMVYHEESTNVLDMWSSPWSQARLQEAVFNIHFGRPQRYNQVMLLSLNSPLSNYSLHGSIFKREIIEELFNILNSIKNITTYDSDGRTITLDDVCYRPMGPDYDCLIMSPTNYFQGDKNNLEVEKPESDDYDFDFFSDDPGWITHIDECIKEPFSQKTSLGLSCFGTYGGPSAPNQVFGKDAKEKSYKGSNSFMMTFLVNQRNEAEITKAVIWERAFVKFMKQYMNKSKMFIVSYMAEQSIMDEIENDAKAEIITIVIALSYLVGYVTFTLGRYFVCENQLTSLLVHSRIILGLVSVIVSTLSSFCSWGIFSMLGVHPVKSALVVQFFIVTLLGVCRTFVCVKVYAKKRMIGPLYGPEDLPMIVGEVASETMPAMISSSLGCTFCFIIGSFTDMPAIRSFCLYAGLSIVVDFILHCTVFLAVFVWDTSRELKGNPEFFLPYPIRDHIGAYLIGRQKSSDTFLSIIFKNPIAPFLMNGKVRLVSGCAFVFGFLVSIFLSSYVQIGFDQSMAFTETSYISSHMKFLDNYMDIGPPVYFTVASELDWHSIDVQNQFCTLPGCNEDSIGNILNYAVEHSDETYLAGEVYNWVDNYLQWISPESPCCKVYVKNPDMFCSTNRNLSLIDDKECRSCMSYDKLANMFDKDSIYYKRPSPTYFYKHLKHFLEDTPNSICVYGGRASFKDAISFTSRGRIQASHFMTFHKKLRISNSTDFVAAMDRARIIARRLSSHANYTINVFAYSKIFPYYEQYSSIIHILTSQLTVSVVGLFAILSLTLGIEIKGAACAVMCQVSNFFYILASMYLFGIQVNAISATNIVMSSAVLIEFSVHVLRGYSASKKSLGTERAEEAIGTIGPIIFAGPFATMAGSTFFLSAAHLEIIRVYYCKQVMIIIISSAIHALIYLPFLLSFGGPPCRRNIIVNPNGEGGEGRLLSPTTESCLSNIVDDPSSQNRSRNLNRNHLFHPLLKENYSDGSPLKSPGGFERAVSPRTLKTEMEFVDS